MDINQSSLSRSKLNKPGIARSASENKAITEANTRKEVQGSQQSSIKQPDLANGQIIKGQIIDHRYHEVKIQLEPSKQIVNAKLSGDVPLSIGHEAQFIVTEDGSDRLVLKYLPDVASPSEATIQKALTASGLPMNDRNRAIVEELLKHTLPVDKQTLQTLIRLSHTNREASPLTLVLMYKNNIPMTQENIRQFEAYQNGTSHLLNDIQLVTKELAKLFQTEVQPLHSDALTDQPTKVNPAYHQALTINNEILDILQSNRSFSDRLPGSVADNLSSLIAQVKQGNMTLEETVKLMKANYPDLEQLLSTELSQIVPTLNNKEQTASIPDILTNLIKQLTPPNNEIRPLPDLINSKDLASLTNLLRSMPSLSQLADQVVEGSITTGELFHKLQEILPQMEPSDVNLLLTSPQYRTLLEIAFHDKWTITPEKLADKAALRELYENLREDMEQLSALSKLVTSSNEEPRLQEPTKNLQDNLRFMQNLNEMFTYLQLPLQMRNQDVHSELYVFTRKKALQSKEDLSVLLHLDMTNLGSMNIHIRMNHNNVLAKFYMDNSESKNLISEFMPSLSEALGKKGYHLQSEVVASYEKIDFSKDFIEDNSVEGELKRYTFDIRT